MKVLGFKVPKLNRRGGMTDVDFIREFFNLNREQFQALYESELEKARNTDRRPGYSGAEENFRKMYPDVHSFVSKSIVRYKKVKKISVKEATDFAIRKAFGFARARYIENFFSGLDKFNIRDEFLFEINEEFDYSRLNITENVVSYTNAAGKIVRIDYENSPYTVSLFVNDKEVGSYGQEQEGNSD